VAAVAVVSSSLVAPEGVAGVVEVSFAVVADREWSFAVLAPEGCFHDDGGFFAVVFHVCLLRHLLQR
jgi:hypothetical protein